MKVIGILLLLLLFSFSSVVRAEVIEYLDTNERGSVSLGITYNDSNNVTGQSYGRAAAGFEVNNEFVSLDGRVSLYAGASELFHERRYVSLGSNIRYDINVSPVNGEQEVPVDIPIIFDWYGFLGTNVTDTSSWTQKAQVTQRIRVYDSQLERYLDETNSIYSSDGLQALEVGGIETFLIGHTGFTVSMSTSALLDAEIYGYAEDDIVEMSVSSYLDPVVLIDPTWEFAGDYSLEYSMSDYPLTEIATPQASTDVPEPLTLGMLGIGLLGVFFGRSKRV